MEKNLTIKDFKRIYSGTWHLNILCPDCGKILSRPLKNFTDCFVELGITGNEELTKTCEEFKDIEQKLWGLIHDYGFEFIDETEE